MTTKALNLLGLGPLDEQPFHKLRPRRATSDERLRFLFQLCVALCTLALRASAATAQCAWADGFSSVPGVDFRVHGAAVFNDGGGDALYVAGEFTVVGDVVASNIAKWDGSSWSVLGSGTMYEPVLALTVFDDGGGPALYAGGAFTIASGVGANYIAKWDGSNWSALGSGTNDSVYELTVFDDGGGPALYAAGEFTAAGGAGANYIARWDGSSWSALASGTNNYVRAVKVFDDGGGPALYAGGSFNAAGGASAHGIAKWDGSSWSAVGSGMPFGHVVALTVFDDDAGEALYAGGVFSTAGGVDANHVAKWDGSSWSALGSGTDGNTVAALAVFDDGSGPALYAGGQFATAGGVGANRIAKWDGSSWSALGSGLDGIVLRWTVVGTLTVFDDGGGEALYAGGEFTTAGGVGATSFARWDGSSWSALTSGTNNSVRAVTVFDDGGGPALYAGGGFITAGDVGANRIGKWDGSSWSALGSGTNDEVFCLTVFEDGSGPDLYAGGKFTAAGEVGASRIARWDGASWSALGSGTDDEVFAISVFNDGAGQALYAGGGFLTAGAVDASYIARWDGENWSPLGAGTDGPVYALAVFDDRSGPALYAGGSFNTAAGVEANNVARWNGSNWSALGSGMGGSVYALAVFDDGGGTALYAGGWFTTAGGAAAKRIAKWDGSNWSALGAGVFNLVSAHVRALTVFDDGDGPALYAGGNFGLAGGVGASNIAKWDGSSWSALGSGMGGVSPLVYALTVFDDGGGEALYAGGRFTIAGGNVSGYIAQWSCDRKSPMCSVAADCGDADDDGVRDEPCSWYSCSAGECDSVSRGFGNGGQFGQADVGSPAGPGVCNVDGVADGNDRFHAMNCFANANFGAPEPYPCEPNSPLTLNVDAGSPASCVLDGVCDGNDVFHTLNSFANTNFEGSGGYPCTCSGSAPRPPALRVEPLEHTGLTLRAPRRAAPGELVHVDVHLTSGLAALRGYQLHLGPGGGGNTAELQLTDISIDSARNDYAFAGVAGVWTAFNRSTAQMLAGMDALEGVPVSPGAYLATFTYRVPEDAAGIFVVEGRSGDHSAATQDRTFLFGAYARPIGVEAGPSTRVTVEEGNRRSRKPE